jgi:small conductance mechanosensitive channel
MLRLLAQSEFDVTELWENIRSEVFQSLALLVMASLVWWLIRLTGRRWIARVVREVEASDDHQALERAQRLHTLWSVGEAILVIVVVALIVVTMMAIWGIPIAPLVAAAGVIGIAVGFGAQDFVRDVIAGSFIVLEDQYAIGDVVQIAGVSGTVEQIRLRTTVLRDLDGHTHHVPNGEIKVASNLTAGFSRVVIDLGVAYKEQVDEVLDVVRDELDRFAADPDWEASFLEPPEVLGVNELADWAVEVRVLLTVRAGDRWRVKREFLRRIKGRFDADGIEIPFPYLKVIHG